MIETMEAPVRKRSFSPTIKCSSCTADIDLAAVAEHVCRSGPHQYAAGEPDNVYNDAFTQYRPEINYAPTASSQAQYEQRPAPISPPYRNNRPVLPKLDSTMSSRSGLRPSEAASIAHDLGLPSPLSAGGSGHRSQHRSRSRTRKASTPRAPSPDIPLSQDCAFPPFPTKQRKPQPEQESHQHKQQSVGRSMTSTKAHRHSPNYSTSSSVYSTTSGPVKRRTSNTSSSQRSRQGTMDDSMSWPSTAPSSPRQSTMTQLSKEQTIDQIPQMPSLVSSQSNTPSEPSLSAFAMPPTPSWPLEPTETSPKIVQSPHSDAAWTPTESTIVEELTYDLESHRHATDLRNKNEATTQPPAREQSRKSIEMFDNPPRQSMSRAKRPSPLLQLPTYTGNDPVMPLSARPAPSPVSNGHGLARTLTNLFGRKRSQSSVSRSLPSPSFDSPRMRALAPEPPERPRRNDGLWNTEEAIDDSSKPQSSFHLTQSTELSYLRDHVAAETVTNDTSSSQIDQSLHSGSANESVSFDFNLDERKPPFPAPVPELVMPPTEHTNRAPVIAESSSSERQEVEEELRRSSMDSASSYGSIGFSHRTKSSRSSHPISGEIKERGHRVSDTNHLFVSTTENTDSIRPRVNDLVPDSPTDPLYNAGKLSPVPESNSVFDTSTTELQGSLSNLSLSPTSDLTPPELSKVSRPATPAGVKGRCRGCANLILTGQKSVSSADGQLTGKYHKECFACQTCKGPFVTADFYVLDDQPYCAQHYHALNNTLCTGCGKGIEGQYFETFDVAGTSSKKFHAKCLQCATCKVQLDEDYFEFHGRVYCERDAFRAANGPRNPYDTVPSRPSPLVREYISSGEPGLKGRFPERRTTRLIMT